MVEMLMGMVIGFKNEIIFQILIVVIIFLVIVLVDVLLVDDDGRRCG